MSPDFEEQGPFMVRAGASARGGEARDGMYLGRAFCSLQGDDFTLLFRERFHGHVRAS